MNLRIYIRAKKAGSGHEVCIAARPTKDEAAVWQVDRKAGLRILASALERTKDHAIRAICDDQDRVIVVDVGDNAWGQNEITVGEVLKATGTRRRV